MAILLLDRRAGLPEFTDNTIARPDVRAMIDRVTFEEDPVAEAAGSHTMTSLVEVRLKNGRVLSARAEFGKGSPQKPMSDEELTTKFTECAAWGGLDESRAAEVAQRVLNLEQEADMSALIAEVAVAGQAQPA